MLIMTGHYGALPFTSLSQSRGNYKDGGCGLATKCVHMYPARLFISDNGEEEKKKKLRDRQTRDWSSVLLNINI